MTQIYDEISNTVFNLVEPMPKFFNDSIGHIFPGAVMLFVVLLAVVLGWFVKQKTKGGWLFFALMTVVFFGFLRWLGFGG